MTALVTMGNWSSMNATTCRPTALNRSSAAQRLDSSLVCPRRSRGRTVTIRSDSFVSAATPIEHSRQHGHVQVGVVVDPYLTLAVIQAMQPSDVLRNRSSP